jgi:hypothetical protein
VLPYHSYAGVTVVDEVELVDELELEVDDVDEVDEVVVVVEKPGCALVFS